MITKELISPKSIVVVGGSDDTSKPGGNALSNLVATGYKGDLFVVNPKCDFVQGVKCFRSVEELPQVDCAILAIPAKLCPSATEILCAHKGCKAVIIFSAGFHEDGPEGAILENRIAQTANKYGASLIGPNCIGVITPHYAGVFTKPVANVSPHGVDIVSGSGATVVFIMETALKLGINFSHVFSVGNSAQIGVEDVLEYLDNIYVEGESSPVKLLYIESINNPQKLLKHAVSLNSKGARIAAIKAGYSEAGSRAASSHTGALASPDAAVDALFRKAGIIRVYSRTELVNMAALLSMPKPSGNNMAIVTHAGGPAVMLADTLCANGINIPQIEGEKADELLGKLYPGSSVSNPIDFLATGTAAQLAHIIDACNYGFNNVDAMAVIFGSPGLADVTDVYKVLREKISVSPKPIYPILTSVVNAEESIKWFQQQGYACFTDEVAFGNAFARMSCTPPPPDGSPEDIIDPTAIRRIVDSAPDGYLHPSAVRKILQAAGIPVAGERVASAPDEAVAAAQELGYPVVLKVIGPVHKTDVGGVVLNVENDNSAMLHFNRLMEIEGAEGVLVQSMHKGLELFIGAKREGAFGTLVMCGLGGVFVEALKDVATGLAPVPATESLEMIHNLKGYSLIAGTRGLEGADEHLFARLVSRVSHLCTVAPEIAEMDINPLLASKSGITAVDARIRIEKML